MVKRPKQKHTPRLQKQPKAIASPDPFKLPPSWQVSMMEMVDEFGWHRIDESKLENIRKKLGHFESMTWSEILVQSSQQNHKVKIADLCKEARDRLEQTGLDDIDELISLRITARERVWGILDQAVLKVLWWDPDHAVCPSPQRHT